MTTPRDLPSQPFRQLRRASGLSIRDLSARTGINRGRLSIIERGVMPTPDEARRIVEALTPDEAHITDIIIGSREPVA